MLLRTTCFTFPLLLLLVACESDDAPPGGPGGAGAESGDHLGACTSTETLHGYEACEEGYSHRAAAETCENVVRSEPVATDSCDIEGDCCASDADCSAEAACWKTGGSEGQEFGTCKRRCDTDADCSASQICECGEGAGRCIEATCKTDADCTGEALCVSSTRDEGCGEVTSYSCQHPDDKCNSRSDCDENGEARETCAPVGTIRECLSQYQSCDS